MRPLLHATVGLLLAILPGCNGSITSGGPHDGSSADVSTSIDIGGPDTWSPGDAGPATDAGAATDGAVPDGDPTWPPVELIHGEPTDPTSCTECLPGVTREPEGSGSWSGGGWSPHAWGDRLVYDLGRAVDCGSLVLRVDGLEPYTQFQPQGVTDMYSEFVAIYEGRDDNHNTSPSQINYLYTPCFPIDPSDPTEQCNQPGNHYRMKVNNGLVTEPLTCDWDSANYTGPIFDPANGTSFTFELHWSARGMTFRVTGNLGGDYELSTTYPSYPNACYASPKTPNLRYLFLGRPPVPDGAYGGYLDGPVYAYAEAWAYDCSTVGW